MTESPRAILFIDGNNWYHSLKRIGVNSPDLDYQEVAKKLLLDGRKLAEIRYYIGKVNDNIARIRRQEKHLKNLRLQNIHISLGRIEKNTIPPKNNPLIEKLSQIIDRESTRIPADVHNELTQLSREQIPVFTEKQVDVRIAVDLVSMAQRDEYDVAYLLSADGDFVPAVEEARRLGKQVFAVSASSGWQLGNAVDTFIRIPSSDWFHGCYR